MTDKYCSTVPPFHPFFRTVTTQDLGDCLQDHVAHFHLDGPWAVTGFYHTIPMSNPSKGHFKQRLRGTVNYLIRGRLDSENAPWFGFKMHPRSAA